MSDASANGAAAGGEIVLEGVGRVFGEGETAVHALRDVSLTIPAGAFVVLLGASGSGKTTLLNIVGGIDAASTGHVRIGDRDLAGMSERELTEYRRTTAAFVFQFYNLVPTLSAAENVQLIADLAGEGGGARTDRMLAAVGLADRRDAFPAQLSGGQQQRVAIARALAKRPRLLLADEPTGSLDLETGRSVLSVLRRLNREQGLTVLLVTHNSEIARMADEVVRLSDGRVTEHEPNPSPVEAEDLSW